MMYKEKQKFTEPALWIGLIISGLVVIGIFGFGYYRQIVQGVPFGNNPMSDNGLILALSSVVLLFLLVFLLFGFARITTVIDKEGITYKFFPFHFKFQKIRWDKIENFDVITYKPIRDYGGWGIKFGKKGRVYSVSGNKGLQLLLKSGRIILIGTQNETELTNFIARLKKSMALQNE